MFYSHKIYNNNMLYNRIMSLKFLFHPDSNEFDRKIMITRYVEVT